MDNAQKAIMIGVGLFITIIIISAVLLIVNLGTGLVDDATSNLSSISSTLQNSILQNYDAKVLSGTQVRTAVNQYMTSTDVSILIAKKGASTIDAVAWTGAKCLIGGTSGMEVKESRATATASIENTSNKIKSFSEVSNPDDAKYINNTSRYYSYIIYNDKDAMVGILFVPQNAVSTIGETFNVTNLTAAS